MIGFAELAVFPVMEKKVKDMVFSPRFIRNMSIASFSLITAMTAWGTWDFYSRHSSWGDSVRCTSRRVASMEVDSKGDLGEFERYVRESGMRDFTVFTDLRSLMGVEVEIRWVERRYPDVNVNKIVQARREELNYLENGKVLDDCTTAFVYPT